MAITYAGIPVETREVDLKNKPKQLLDISPKGTVPVLQLINGEVIEQSLDIMHWALAQHDPEHWWLVSNKADRLIKWNDGDFKYYLDRYKYADRYTDFSEGYYRQQAEVFLTELETRLMNSRYLCGNDFSLADAAIFPFIRQFAGVDKIGFQASPFQALNNWLEAIVATELFALLLVKLLPVSLCWSFEIRAPKL